MGIDILFLYIDVKLFYITIFPRFIYKVFKIARMTQLKSNKIATFYRTNTPMKIIGISSKKIARFSSLSKVFFRSLFET